MERVALKGDPLRGTHSAGLVIVNYSGNIMDGSYNVFINGTPAARVGDTTVEYCSAHDDYPLYGTVSEGSSKVFINGAPAAYAMRKVNPHMGSANLVGGGSSNVYIR